jgi:hypothetical protein
MAKSAGLWVRRAAHVMIDSSAANNASKVSRAVADRVMGGAMLHENAGQRACRRWRAVSRVRQTASAATVCRVVARAMSSERSV